MLLNPPLLLFITTPATPSKAPTLSASLLNSLLTIFYSILFLPLTVSMPYSWGNIFLKGKSDVKFLCETSQQLSYHPDKIPALWSGVKILEDLGLMREQPRGWPLQGCLSAALQLAHCSRCNGSLTK